MEFPGGALDSAKLVANNLEIIFFSSDFQVCSGEHSPCPCISLQEAMDWGSLSSPMDLPRPAPLRTQALNWWKQDLALISGK